VLRAREVAMAVGAWIWPSLISEMMPSAWTKMDGRDKRRGRRMVEMVEMVWYIS